MSNKIIQVEYKHVEEVLPVMEELKKEKYKLEKAKEMLLTKSGKGAEYLGWLDLPYRMDASFCSNINEVAKKIREHSEVLVVIGIGGSYLGAKAALEMLLPPFVKPTTEILFAGHNMASDYLAGLLSYLEDKRFSINIISKSGGTLEPMLSFRLLRGLLEKQVGVEEAKNRIIATTENTDNLLNRMANTLGYQTLDLPKDVGGRYSVLSAVGLLPLAVAGIDIGALMLGSLNAKETLDNTEGLENPAILYAGLRNLLYQKGKKMELFVGYEHGFSYFAEWWKQLYAESEGKENKGIFTASATFTTDLHSLGQYIQEGERHLFETVLRVLKTQQEIHIPSAQDNLDKLDYLIGKSVSDVNEKAFLGVLQAHKSGGVPNIVIELSEVTPYTFGYLVYFFEFACGISGYYLGVNPFDQPGVEAYKKNMNQLLGK